MYATALKQGAAVLMARIVDAAGVCIRRSSIAAIEYSIVELDPHRPERRKLVAGHHAVSLELSNVMTDALWTGGAWTVDAAGYNFRHEIYASRSDSFPRTGARYEIRYVFLLKFGAAAIVRFHVRIIPK